MSKLKAEIKHLKQKNRELQELINAKPHYHEDTRNVELQSIIDEMIKTQVLMKNEKGVLEDQHKFLKERHEDLKYHNTILLDEINFYEKINKKIKNLISSTENYISEGNATESEGEVITELP